MSIRDLQFGVEIEMTGLTREKAVKVIGEHFNERTSYGEGRYYTIDENNRQWRFKSDGSIRTYVNKDHQVHDSRYSVEFVTPICRYEDIPRIQECIRTLRQNGAITNDSCGVHIHVDARDFTPDKLKNLSNIMFSKEDLLFKTLKVLPARRNRYCHDMYPNFIEQINQNSSLTMEQIMNIYHNNSNPMGDRYQALNFRALNDHGTVEFRLFNGTLHAGEIKAYIHLCLAICNQALTQTRASRIKTVSENECYTFRTWLLRLGMIGDEFKSTRHHLLKNLEGNKAWKDPTMAHSRISSQQHRNQACAYYAAYGIEMSRVVMRGICPHAEIVGVSLIPDHQLRFRGTPVGVPVLEKAAAKSVPVGIWQIPIHELQNLDCVSLHNDYFERDQIQLNIRGNLIEAYYYRLNNQNMEYSFPDTNDFRKMLSGYDDFSIDQQDLFRAVDDTCHVMTNQQMRQSL